MPRADACPILHTGLVYPMSSAIRIHEGAPHVKGRHCLRRRRPDVRVVRRSSEHAHHGNSARQAATGALGHATAVRSRYVTVLLRARRIYRNKLQCHRASRAPRLPAATAGGWTSPSPSGSRTHQKRHTHGATPTPRTTLPLSGFRQSNAPRAPVHQFSDSRPPGPRRPDTSADSAAPVRTKPGSVLRR